MRWIRSGVLLLSAIAVVGLPAQRGWAQEVSATLTPAPEPATAPVATPNTAYRPATLVVRSSLAKPVGAVSLRAREGGPWLLYPLTIAPRGQGTLAISLPATLADQSYTIELFDRYSNGRVPMPPVKLATISAPISWPVDRVDAGQIVQPLAFAPFSAGRLNWPVAFRHQVLIVLAGLLVLSGFLLLIRGRFLRALALLALVAGTMAMLGWMASQASPPLTETLTMEVVQRHSPRQVTLQTLTLLASRRTAEGEAGTADTWCVYPDAGSMAADYTILRPLEPRFSKGIPVVYRTTPGRVKMLMSRTQPDPREAPPTVKLDLRQEPATLVSDRAVPPSLLIGGARFLPIDALADRAPRPIASDQMQLWPSVSQDRTSLGFDEPTWALLTWWDRTQRRGETMYLVWPSLKDATPRLYVDAVVTPE